MAFDFDPFSQLDINVNGLVDEYDLKVIELEQGLPPTLNDMNHDVIPDILQKQDLNADGIFDNFQADLDRNSVIDKFEEAHLGTKFSYDLNSDGQIDQLDAALAKVLLLK